MMLTTVLAEAGRKVRLENGPDFFTLHFTAFKIGRVAFFGIPGEPFMAIGKSIKELPGYDLIFPTCNTNAKVGYFPNTEAYDEGGYEAGASPFKSGVAERIVDSARQMLGELK
jgi:hypothetical protein